MYPDLIITSLAIACPLYAIYSIRSVREFFAHAIKEIMFTYQDYAYMTRIIDSLYNMSNGVSEAISLEKVDKPGEDGLIVGHINHEMFENHMSKISNAKESIMSKLDKIIVSNEETSNLLKKVQEEATVVANKLAVVSAAEADTARTLDIVSSAKADTDRKLELISSAKADTDRKLELISSAKADTDRKLELITEDLKKCKSYMVRVMSREWKSRIITKICATYNHVKKPNKNGMMVTYFTIDIFKAFGSGGNIQAKQNDFIKIAESILDHREPDELLVKDCLEVFNRDMPSELKTTLPTLLKSFGWNFSLFALHIFDHLVTISGNYQAHGVVYDEDIDIWVVLRELNIPACAITRYDAM